MDIKIRPLAKKDAYTSVKWRNKPEIWRYTGFKATKEITIQDELKWIGKVIEDKTCRRFAIEVDNKYVGNIYLTDIKDGIGEYHIFIGNQDYWNKGIAREASKQIINFGKNELKLNNIELGVKAENIRAYKLYESLGFKEYGKEGEFIRMSLRLKDWHNG